MRPDSDVPPSERSVLDPLLPARAGERLVWERLHGSAVGLAVSAAAARCGSPVVVVTADSRRAEQIAGEMRFYGDTEVLPFPDWECLPYDVFSPHPDIVSRRLLTLYRLPDLQRGIVVLPVQNLMQRLPPREYVAGHSFVLRVRDRVDIEELRRRLQHAGYHSVGQVMGPGEYAVRGGLIDLYPMGAARPYRIDLFDDEVDSIRHFDPDTQRSTDRLNSVQLLPAREFPMTEEAVRRFRSAFRERFEGDPTQVPVYQEVSKGIAPPGIEFYLPLFYERTATLFDYLPAGAIIVRDGGVADAAARFAAQVAERHDNALIDPQRPPLPPSDIFLGEEELAGAQAAFRRIDVDASGELPSGRHRVRYATRPPEPLAVNAKAESPYAALIGFLQTNPGRVLLAAETAGRREVLKGVLRDHGVSLPDVAGWAEYAAGGARHGLTISALERGLALTDPPLCVITEAQLYGEHVAQRRRRGRRERDPEAIIRSLAELKVGDPVVHEDHGVGRYLGLQSLNLGGDETEFLTLEYRDGDKLYLPVMSLHLIGRYTGTHPEHVPLHKLGGKEWEKAKRRARERIHDVAAELLEVQALRAARRGHAYPARDEGYAAFAADFAFEETPDQERAIDEVLSDMEAPRPMDRLVCGDVGFGKTEVALRAAFAAVQGERQVAVLVPTTLLAQQHFQNFADRFADQPVRVELLSRFRTKTEQDAVVAGARNGTVDIVIGTHRLLQPDMRFKRLGLVIIDEEHRFGVRQKERLKRLRSEVDILTLTATPIPRTMNLAMAGLRDVSIIATPPQERLSVKTFVTEWNMAVVREACLREIRRGGQVFFLHNDVRTIDRTAAEIEQLVPEARVRVAHGQMPERELEAIMRDFYHQRFNLLVCTTIIESGIDIPSANTIVIQRADRFGLAQLHQLRGRVGRSHHQAFAYLIIPPRRSLRGDALKRLEAIVSLDELGAGFSLASHDLEIRGAGELLGESQSGMIDEIGFNLYMELLSRAVATLKAGGTLTDAALDQPLHGRTEVNLHEPVLLPDAYIPDVHTRLVMYKRIANAESADELDELRAETIDRFGPLPPPGDALFRLTKIKLAAMRLGIQRVDVGPRGGAFLFEDRPRIDPAALIRVMQGEPGRYRMEGANRLRISAQLEETDEREAFVTELLGRLAEEG